MGLLDAAAWQGNVFLAGVWVPGSGGDYPVVAPATGGELARMGRPTAADVEVAARSAGVAQAGWAATPHPQRAAVLRRAGDLCGELIPSEEPRLSMARRMPAGVIAVGLALAERIPTGIVHINDQTVSDEANAPFGGTGASGTGSRFGGHGANVDAFTETRWITVRSEPPSYSF